MYILKSMKSTNNSKGQAILFAVVGVTVALAIGVTVASRNLSSSSRTSRTDTSARAYAAAEGGIERLLALTDSSLSNLANPTPNCASAGFEDGTNGFCILKYDPVAGDSITSVAELKVEVFNYNDDADSYYRFTLDNGFTKEVALFSNGVQYPNNRPVTICWSNPKAALYYYSYNSSGVMSKGALRSSTNDTVFPNYPDTSSDGFLLGNTPGIFPYCRQITLVTTPYGLRIRALYDQTEVGVFPSAELPIQGYRLISNGKILQQSEVRETKMVRVYRSLPYMPSFFDSAIYSATGQIN